MLLIDAHLDLAMNALNWDRNLDLTVDEIRRSEAGMIKKGRGRGTVSLPELRAAEVAVSLATVIDRTARPGSPTGLLIITISSFLASTYNCLKASSASKNRTSWRCPICAPSG